MGTLSTLHWPVVPHTASANLGRVLLFAGVGTLLFDLPVGLHGAALSRGWTLAGALGGALFETLVLLDKLKRSRALWLSLVVAGVGMGLDFCRIAPEALLSLCAPTASWWALPLAHLRWYPATCLLMLLWLLTRPAYTAPRGAMPGVAGEFGAMVLAMAYGPLLLKAPTIALGLPWASNGMVGSMLLCMLAGGVLYRGAASLACAARWLSLRR